MVVNAPIVDAGDGDLAGDLSGSLLLLLLTTYEDRMCGHLMIVVLKLGGARNWLFCGSARGLLNKGLLL